MARQFSAQRGDTRVVFGAGSVARIGQEIETLGARLVLVVTSAARRDAALAIAEQLGPRAAGVIATARQHVPVDLVTGARGEVARTGADTLLAYGGGSSIGLAKAVALESAVRVAALPTTYSGSEMTPIYGITEGGKKRTGRDERVRPKLVVYDPELLAALPRETAVASIWNAMAHAVEALWARDADRATLFAAEEALRLLGSSVLALVAEPDDVSAREQALEGAYLAGTALADAGTGLHHKLCHVLGGSFGLPHAMTHAVLLPHVVRWHAEAAPDAMAAIARALHAADAVQAMERLARDTVGTPGLEALGLHEADVALAVDELLAAPPTHPRPPDRPSLIALLEGAMAPTSWPEPPPLRAPTDLPEGRPGFGSTHTSEALPGALPKRQNMPRPPPYGLYPELLSGTPFTVRSAENSRVWMYRVRASFSHGPFRPLPAARFAAPLGEVEPTRMRWRALPVPPPAARVDFVDGLFTLGGAGDPSTGPGYAVHLYAANADMADRSFDDSDGDVLIVPQTGALDCRTELGWLRVAPGSILLIPRAVKFAIGLPEGSARGWMLEVFGPELRLPERGPIGSNGLADPRHFLAPVASFEDRLCPGGFEILHKVGGRIWSATQEHSPFDVVAWHGNHVPYSYDLSLFNAMGAVTFDHPDPSIFTVLTAPLDDHGRSAADFVIFPPRWQVAEHSFRPPFMHRNAASEINGVVRTPSPDAGYEAGCTFVTPLLTAHGISTSAYDAVLSLPDDIAERPERLSDESLWIMFESALPFRPTRWARETPLLDGSFLALFAGMPSRFQPP